MPADHHQITAGQTQHLGDQQPQFAIAEHDDALGRTDVQPVGDLQCRCERLREDRGGVRHGVGDGIEQVRRQGEAVGHHAISPADAKRGALGGSAWGRRADRWHNAHSWH